MNIRRFLREIATYKQAILLQRKATTLTKMQRVIQRIATKRLIRAFEEAQLDGAAMASDYLVVAALLGVPASQAFSNRNVKAELDSMGGNTGIKWKPNIVKSLRSFTQLSNDQKENIIGKLYSAEEGSAAYIAGKMVAQSGVPVATQIRQNSGAIVNSFQMKVRNLAIDLTRSNEFAVEQESGSMEDQDLSGNSIVDTNSLIRGLDSWGDDHSDADTFLTLCMVNTNSPLSKKVRVAALGHIKTDLEKHFKTSKRPWLELWAKDVYTSKGGFFEEPGGYQNFKGQRELLNWIFSKYNKPTKFEKIAWEAKGNFKGEVVGNDLIIVGCKNQMGSAEKSNKNAYVVTFSLGNTRSKVMPAMVEGRNNIIIRNFVKKFGHLKTKEVTVKNLHFINTKVDGTSLAARVSKLPVLLESLWNSNDRLRKDLYPIMMTEDVFRRSLQAKRKQRGKLKRHTNVPF